jgi:hypothetical protein
MGLATEWPASRPALCPQVTVGESKRKRIAVSPENWPLSMGRQQQPDVWALVCPGFPALEKTRCLTFRLAAQTTAETGPQVKPRDALQQTHQFPSAEVLPVALQLNVQVPVGFSSPIATRDPGGLAVRFAHQSASRTRVRTIPGTVPGTVPRVTREASFPATYKWLVVLTYYETVSYR